MRPEILQGALTLEQRANGLSLEEDDHCLYLLYKGKQVAVFSATGATVQSIRQEAEKVLNEASE